MRTVEDLQSALYAYTLEHRGASFAHQHVVDAFAAQYADESTPPMRLTFALVGLYLHVECGYTGVQVQRMHATLARRRRTWPRITIPTVRGAWTAADVLAAPSGPSRDAAISAWCASVWAAYVANRDAVVDYLKAAGVA